MRHVTEWGIPAVLADWFWTSVQVATKLPYEDFLVQESRTASLADAWAPGVSEDSTLIQNAYSFHLLNSSSHCGMIVNKTVQTRMRIEGKAIALAIRLHLE